MKDKNKIQLGDLVSLEGLEKPGEEVLKVELGENAERATQLGESIGDLAGNIEAHNDVQIVEVARLVEGLKKALVKELSPEDTAILLTLLKLRFEFKHKFYKSAEGIKWEDVQKKLEANPEKLWSLQQMEDTGGQPDIMDYDKKTGEYIFIDCSAESPTRRRNCVYDREAEKDFKEGYPDQTCNSNAVSMAAFMGIDILTEKEYRELQTKGQFDKENWSWIKTPVDKRKAGVALVGGRGGDDVNVDESDPYNPSESGAWRGGLRI